MIIIILYINNHNYIVLVVNRKPKLDANKPTTGK